MKLVNAIKYKFVLVLVALSMIGIMAAGCAKDVGQDNVPIIASGIFDASEIISGKGLDTLNQFYPEQTPIVISSLESIVEIAGMYTDGKMTGRDVAMSVSVIIDQVNAQFELLDSIYADFIYTGLDFLARQFDRFVEAKQLPEEFGLYLSSLSMGIQEGLAWYHENNMPEPETEVTQ